MLPTGTAVEPHAINKIAEIISRDTIDASDVLIALGKMQGPC